MGRRHGIKELHLIDLIGPHSEFSSSHSVSIVVGKVEDVSLDLGLKSPMGRLATSNNNAFIHDLTTSVLCHPHPPHPSSMDPRLNDRRLREPAHPYGTLA